MKLSIVIPVYNEKATLEEIFRLVQAHPLRQRDHRGGRRLHRRLPGHPGPAGRAV